MLIHYVLLSMLLPENFSEGKKWEGFKELERSDFMFSILALKLKQIPAKYAVIVKEENSYYSDILI